MPTEPFQYEMYAVRNKQGQWFRRKGYGGYGSNWVDDIAQARIYLKPGPARGQIGYYAKNFPDFGVPDLVKLQVTQIEIVDETERVMKSQRKAQKDLVRRDARQKKRELEWAKQEVDRANARLADALAVQLGIK
jgi:hypothetical protein